MSNDSGRGLTTPRTLLIVAAILGSVWLLSSLQPPSARHPHPADNVHSGSPNGFNGALAPNSGAQRCPECEPAKTVTVTVTVKAKPEECTNAPGTPGKPPSPAPEDDRGRKNAFDYVYDHFLWGDKESLSGPGSYFNYTDNARRFISTVLRTYKLGKILDSPCGDCHWQWAIPEIRTGSVEYTGIDIVENVILGNTLKHIRFPNMRFAAMDFVSREDVLLPKNRTSHADPEPLWEVINCRDALQHIHIDDGLKAVKNFERSGAKYLITGWYSGGNPNQADTGKIGAGSYYAIDPMLPPFNFPRPLFWTLDGWNLDLDYKQRKNMKMIGVWKLPVLGKGDGTTIPLDMDKIWDWWENKSKVQIVEGDNMNVATWVDDPGLEHIISPL
ncbi:hypothetical protein M427DRAFT_66368 [Gonapodya prolifera JEL478]|uniref:Methyltransferase domain-containing protein n=1 Tax=Gonapodya prolifera (strain JEL478) TaxID=1344416 RepID=A0A139AWF5_GONPJ|nr:hypothetical protein M427DRAFT_66368 [Gonapodya prolifera JEL478]|eukprot:KXS21039.1 hypothetical protein M427DRAFT_66368 [Gonapodya prolifera JEL478]